MSSPLLVPTPSCIPPLAKDRRSHDGHPSTSRSLEPDITLPSSAARANPFLKVNTFRHGLSTASLHSRDLLRQLSKERLVVRCSPTSARQSSKIAPGARRYDSPLPAPQAPLFAAPCASCTLYVAYPACASLAKKALTSAALKAGVVGVGAALSVVVRPLLDSRLWVVRCAQKLPGCWAGLV